MTTATVPARRPKEDMHPADIKALLAKKGYTFKRIADENDYKENSPANVLRIAWAPMEKIVGKILGVHPSFIWPSRYDLNGNPLRSRRISNS